MGGNLPAGVLDVWCPDRNPSLGSLLSPETLLFAPSLLLQTFDRSKVEGKFYCQILCHSRQCRPVRPSYPPFFVHLNPAAGACHKSPGRDPLSLSSDIHAHRITNPADTSIAAIMLIANHRIVVTFILAVSSCALSHPSRDSVLNALQKEKKVILVLVDGVRYDYVKDPALKGFQRMARKGVKAEYVQPIFPSNSYPNWYTIVTGTQFVVFADDCCLFSCALPASTFIWTFIAVFSFSANMLGLRIRITCNC